jgi:hypothetical protein
MVVNLITVALTRAKKKVIMFVPAYEDKFSKALSLFETCPKPNLSKIRQDKMLSEFKFTDYLNMEHCVTELIRASVIKYDTRIDIRTNIKMFNFSKIFDEDVSYKTAPIITEEDKAFVGILIENLTTSTWINRWPHAPNSDAIDENPMLIHIVKRIKNSIKKYNMYISTNIFNDTNQFEGILLYSQIHIALSNKLFITLSDTLKNNLKSYWIRLKPKVLYK